MIHIRIALRQQAGHTCSCYICTASHSCCKLTISPWSSSTRRSCWTAESCDGRCSSRTTGCTSFPSRGPTTWEPTTWAAPPDMNPMKQTAPWCSCADIVYRCAKPALDFFFKVFFRKGEWCQRLCDSVCALTLARKPCFATFAGVGGATPPPLGVSKRSVAS